MNIIIRKTVLNLKINKLEYPPKSSEPPKNRILYNTHIEIIFEYSPKKNKAKPIAEYSTL